MVEFKKSQVVEISARMPWGLGPAVFHLSDQKVGAATRREGGAPPNQELFLKPADEQFAFIDHLRRQVIMKVDEQAFVGDHFLAPGFAVHFH
jgi:hypothetical protein